MSDFQARFCSGCLSHAVDDGKIVLCPACKRPVERLCRNYVCSDASNDFEDVQREPHADAPLSPSIVASDEDAAIALQERYIEEQQDAVRDRLSQRHYRDDEDKRARQVWERELQSGLAAQAAAASGARAARGGEGGSSTAEERRKRSEPVQEAEDLAPPGPPSKKPRAAGTASEAEAEALGAVGDLRAGGIDLHPAGIDLRPAGIDLYPGADDTEVVPAAKVQEVAMDAQADTGETPAAKEADEVEADEVEADEVEADDDATEAAMDTSAEEAPAGNGGDGDASGGSPEDVNDEEQTLEQPETAAAGSESGSESGETTAAAPAGQLSLDEVLECMRKGDIERFAVELPKAPGETNSIRLNAIQAYREAGGDPDKLPNIDSPAGKKEPLPDGWVILKAPETIVDRDAARYVKLLYILTAAVAATHRSDAVDVVPFL